MRPRAATSGPPRRCFAWNTLIDGRTFEPCPHDATERLGDQHYCGFHFGMLVDAVRKTMVVVYFAAREDRIKIGISSNPSGRMRVLGARLLATEPGGRRRERELHALFDDAALGGEWFRETPELTAYIQELRAA